MNDDLDHKRQQKVDNIINQYRKINDLIIDSCNELNIQVCIAIHIRDTENRSVDYPDGYGTHLMARYCTDFQKALFVSMVKYFFAYSSQRQDIDDEEED